MLEGAILLACAYALVPRVYSFEHQTLLDQGVLRVSGITIAGRCIDSKVYGFDDNTGKISMEIDQELTWLYPRDIQYIHYYVDKHVEPVRDSRPRRPRA